MPYVVDLIQYAADHIDIYEPVESAKTVYLDISEPLKEKSIDTAVAIYSHLSAASTTLTRKLGNIRAENTLNEITAKTRDAVSSVTQMNLTKFNAVAKDSLNTLQEMVQNLSVHTPIAVLHQISDQLNEIVNTMKSSLGISAAQENFEITVENLEPEDKESHEEILDGFNYDVDTEEFPPLQPIIE
eukprot:TRINITY_DN2654_c0_g1_i1.p1 TRINITY_DN2654_c0_g1~~TRINITY_DN2654_c0_g1_i1.p1  ORF type:complete len:186 (-),score=45.88 TRINITY_DN2654_c0_g1_i1:21-578(-)